MPRIVGYHAADDTIANSDGEVCAKVKRLYWEEEMSTYEIGALLGISFSTVREIMIKWNIPRRSISEAITVAHRKKPEAFYSWEPSKHEGYNITRITKDNPFYPMSEKGFINVSRLTMAQHIGKCLSSYEVVHHKNGVRDDDRIENLELITNGHTHPQGYSIGYKRGYESGYRKGVEDANNRLPHQ